jgi:nicotinate-nucleotide adenylyltransferase
VTTGKLRLGVLGGTFDPIHAAHLQAAAAARDSLHLNRVLFIPAGDPWRKRDRRVTPAEHRLAMVQAAIEACGDPSFEVSDLEVRRAGATYTSDTLRELRQQGDVALWFILGADAVLDLPRWHEPGVIIQLARLAVVPRPGPPVDVGALDDLVPGLSAAIDSVAMEPIDLSATELRARLLAPDRLAVDERVPAGARKYIVEHDLYRPA